ncbi:MAG: hypothetical protein ACI88A_000737 [Paraglaciecola sp.]|jgi:hypothetical protein
MNVKTCCIVISLLLAPSVSAMDDGVFWRLIQDSVIEGEDYNIDTASILVGKLVELDKEAIIEFERILRDKLIKAEDFTVMIPLQVIDSFIGEDAFLYYRCWLVSRGKEVYEKSFEDPDYLATVINEDTEAEFSELLDVTTEAYSTKTGIDEEGESFPRDVAVMNGFDIDDFSRKTKGEEWSEDDIPKLAPKLWAVFN